MSIKEIIESTYEQLSEIRFLAGVYVPTASKLQKTQIDKYNDKIDKADDLMRSAKKSDQHKGESELHEAIDKYKEWINGQHSKTLLQSLFTYQFAIFDAFMGNVLKEIYSNKPELVEAIERQFSLKDIKNISSMKALKSYIIDKEIDSIRRDSYVEQFKSMENRFGISTLRNFDSWASFTESAQRRHLFTHCDGIVNDQYLSALKLVGKSTEHKVGDEVKLTPSYFKSSTQVISETAIKLGLVLWSKFWPNEKNDQDSFLNDTIVEAVSNHQYDLAIELGDFETYFKVREDVTRRMIVINLAQAHKWKGDSTNCKKVLAKEDWSASRNEFQMCVNILKDDFDTASDNMKAIGKETDLVAKASYLHWPIVKEFVKSDQFKTTYKKLYRQEFLKAQTAQATKTAKAKKKK